MIGEDVEVDVIFDVLSEVALFVKSAIIDEFTLLDDEENRFSAVTNYMIHGEEYIEAITQEKSVIVTINI
jgi:hypothetical protein